MPRPSFDPQKAHHWFAVELNNAAWDLLESTTRTREDDERMVHAAHAACLHWLEVGTPLNHQRAQCLLANVYSAVGHAESALRHAQRCLELSEQNGEDQADFDRATAYECAARANACAGRAEEARQLKERARQVGDGIKDTQEREIFDRLLGSGKWYGIE